MPHAFNQNEHPFGQCLNFSQIEPFEKPWFLVMDWTIYQWAKAPNLGVTLLSTCGSP
jgi:hypothetical protein